MTVRGMLRATALVVGVAGIIGFGVDNARAIDEPTKAEQQAALANVPAKARQYYDHYWYNAPVSTNPYANWTPPPPPWQFCINDSMLGTSWRTDLLNEVKKLNAQYHAAGLTKADVLVTDFEQQHQRPADAVQQPVAARLQRHHLDAKQPDRFVLRHA